MNSIVGTASYLQSHFDDYRGNNKTSVDTNRLDDLIVYQLSRGSALVDLTSKRITRSHDRLGCLAGASNGGNYCRAEHVY